MGLSDSRPGPLPVIYSRWRCGLSPRRSPAGSPRFLGGSVPARCPLPPREVRRLLLPIASSPVSGFIPIGRTVHFRRVTRPKRVRLRYGSQVRFSRLRQTGCPVPRSIGYVSNGEFTLLVPFTSQAHQSLSWRTRGTRIRPNHIRFYCSPTALRFLYAAKASSASAERLCRRYNRPRE